MVDNMKDHVFMLIFFFFNDTATTEIYTLSLHDALPICWREEPDAIPVTSGRSDHDARGVDLGRMADGRQRQPLPRERRDRKSTRLNSSHANISYAVFCLKKKKTHKLFSSHSHNFYPTAR